MSSANTTIKYLKNLRNNYIPKKRKFFDFYFRIVILLEITLNGYAIKWG
jgi:hypothetical protein